MISGFFCRIRTRSHVFRGRDGIHSGEPISPALGSDPALLHDFARVSQNAYATPASTLRLLKSFESLLHNFNCVFFPQEIKKMIQADWKLIDHDFNRSLEHSRLESMNAFILRCAVAAIELGLERCVYTSSN